MLRALYITATAVTSGDDNNTPKKIPSVDPELWTQIALFLTKRKSLLSSNHKVHDLQGILSDAKSISKTSPLKAPLKRMNTSLKSNSTSKNKLSLSFLTQEQQMQIHSLSLNSPSRTAIRETGMISPFSVQGRFRGGQQVNVSQRGQSNYRGHAGGGRIHHWSSNTAGNGNSHMHDEKNTSFNSMNLVTMILKKRHDAAVHAARVQREPFMPLFKKVLNLIDVLSKELAQCKQREKEQTRIEDMTENDLRKVVKDYMYGQDCMIGGGCEEKSTAGGGTDDKDDSRRALNMEDEMAKIEACLGLWRALGASLDNVLSVHF